MALFHRFLGAQNYGLFSPVPGGRILRSLLERMGPLKEFDCTFESTKLWPFFTDSEEHKTMAFFHQFPAVGFLEGYWSEWVPLKNLTSESTKLWPLFPNFRSSDSKERIGANGFPERI